MSRATPPHTRTLAACSRARVLACRSIDLGRPGSIAAIEASRPPPLVPASLSSEPQGGYSPLEQPPVMAERGPGKKKRKKDPSQPEGDKKQPDYTKQPWCAAEDKLLMDVIAKTGLPQVRVGSRNVASGPQWPDIAAQVAGRTAKQCRERWRHTLDPSIKKEPWTEEENAILNKAYQELGSKWADIATRLPGRTDEKCAAVTLTVSARLCTSAFARVLTAFWFCASQVQKSVQQAVRALEGQGQEEAGAGRRLGRRRERRRVVTWLWRLTRYGRARVRRGHAM